MKTADRGLVLVGIKLMGLVLLCYAVVSFGQAAIIGVTSYRAYKIAEQKSPWQTPPDIREDVNTTELMERSQMKGETKELMVCSQMEDAMKEFTYQLQAYKSLFRLPWLLLVGLVGLYMCRNGGIVLVFLTGKDTQDSQHS